ncbi:MAG: hypothetical protein SOY60_03930 [Fusobacterium gastrosuis]|uniref:pyocin knob domain-containing protein n=1 Tax=Fusobacterium gastrosuis TaxID=1755100 RepID=UPI002A8FA834|nr:hypothetical protein [Fusobacterium gastrosuis]
MANWIDDPQGREEVEKVTQELKLPILKPNAKGKFRPWLTEVWGKIEDYLINLKNIANSKEPLITKKTAFNLDKTNLTENDSNKLFTAKGALDLFNTLTTNFTNAVNTAKEYFRTELVKKIDKTSISDSLTSTSQTTVLSSAGAKALEDKKVNITHIAKSTDTASIGLELYYSQLGSKPNGLEHNDPMILNLNYSPEWRNQLALDFNANMFIRGNDRSKNYETPWYRFWTDKDFEKDINFRTDINANNITKDGIYAIHNNGATTANNFPISAWAFLRVTTIGSGTFQEFTDILNFRKYQRYKNNGIWSSWDSIHRWANVIDKPSVFPAATHTHSWASLTGKPAFINVVDSTSTTDFATPRSVKLAYDKGVAALTEAQKKENAFAKNTAHNKNFGTTAGTVLEGNKIDQITGKTYGGILNTAGAKTAGKTYFDNNTKKLFLCKNNNSDTSANVNNYIALDNNSLLDRLENLSNFTHNIFTATGTGFAYVPKNIIKNKELSIYSCKVNLGENPSINHTKLTILNNHSIAVCDGESQLSFKEVGNNYLILFYGKYHWNDNSVQVFLN